MSHNRKQLLMRTTAKPVKQNFCDNISQCALFIYHQNKLKTNAGRKKFSLAADWSNIEDIISSDFLNRLFQSFYKILIFSKVKK